MQRPRSRVRGEEWPSVAPASALDYVRTCTLAKEAYRLLMNTSTLAWQIYGVTSPQGRDGDKILAVGQDLFGALRCDARDLWLPDGPWADDCEEDRIFSRFYPPRRKDLVDLPDEVLELYGRGARGRCAPASIRCARPKKPGPRIPLRYDREAATARAKEMRAQGFSLSKIGLQLRKERLTPLRGGVWHPAQVAELLRAARPGDREAAARRASELRAQGMQLREIGVRLAVEGFLPKEGGIWHPSQVHALLTSEESADLRG